MGKLRWYKRDPDAALNGMANLTLEERGAYNTLLDLIYSRDGQVDDDPRFIAGWLRCDLRVWKRIRGRLIELGKLYVQDGALKNKRADREVARGLSMVASASDAGKASARKRKSETKENKEIDSTLVEQTSQLTTTTTKKEDSSLREGAKAPPVSRETLFDQTENTKPIYTDSKHELWGEGIPILVSLGVPNKQARSIVGKWMRDTRDDAVAVLGAIQRARDNRVIAPIEWITRALQTNGGTHDGPGKNGKSPGSQSRTVAQDALVAGMAAALSERPDSRLGGRNPGGWGDGQEGGPDDRSDPRTIAGRVRVG